MENNIRDLIIIGAGPAGLTATIYARRANLDVMILESSAPGGKIVKTAEVENWPGQIHTTGPDLAFSMFEHAMSLKVDYQQGNVVNVEDGEVKVVHTDNGKKYYARAVLIATGTIERKMNVPGEQEFSNKGVSYCAVCDGALFKDKVVTVVGGGNSAVEEAIYLTKFASKVNIIIRRDVFRGDKKVVDRLYENEKINVITKSIPKQVVGDNKVTGLMITNVDTNEDSVVETDGIFPFIGLDPITEFVKDLNIVDERNYIIANEKMETSVKGIYAAGDVIKKELRQIVTAANDGAVAAQEILKYIEENRG